MNFYFTDEPGKFQRNVITLFKTPESKYIALPLLPNQTLSKLLFINGNKRETILDTKPQVLFWCGKTHQHCVNMQTSVNWRKIYQILCTEFLQKKQKFKH